VVIHSEDAKQLTQLEREYVRLKRLLAVSELERLKLNVWLSETSQSVAMLHGYNTHCQES